MAKYEENKVIREKVDADGNIIEKTEESTVKSINRSDEPEYIKLYTKMWCEFNNIPMAYRNLFLELVVRMGYATGDDTDNSQIVFTGKPVSNAICKALGWSPDGGMLYKGLKELCSCGAIRKVNRGVYQINPNYAGRGKWKYDGKLKQGGISNLIAVFDFGEHDVNTIIEWEEDKEKRYTKKNASQDEE